MSQVNWSKLEHCYGTAEDVPALLTSLRSENKRERKAAHSRLEDLLYHQGYRYTATEAAIPFLVEVAVVSETEDAIRLVNLLADLAVGYPSDAIHSDFQRDLLTSHGPEAGCFRMVAAAERELLSLLQSDSPRLRAAVLGLFANVPPSEAAPLLAALRDKNGIVRGLACVALVRRARFHNDDIGLQLVVDHAKKVTGGAERVCAATAWAMCPGGPHAAAVTSLFSAIPFAKASRDFPWDDGNLLPFALKSLASLAVKHRDTIPAERIVDVFSSAIHAHAQKNEELADDLAAALVETIFPRPIKHDSCFFEAPKEPHELLLIERCALKVIASIRTSSQFVGDPLWDRGFPLHRLESDDVGIAQAPIRRYLGLEPPSAWVRPLDGWVEEADVRWPLYKWTRSTTLGIVHPQAFQDALARLDDPDLIECACTVASSPYDLQRTCGYYETLGCELAIEALQRRGPGMCDVVERRLESKDQDDAGESVLVLLLSRWSIAAGAFLPHWLSNKVKDALARFQPQQVAVQWGREIAVAVVPEQRDQIIWSLGLPQKDEYLYGWFYLDLCTDRNAAVQRAVEAIARWPLPTSPMQKLEKQARMVLVALAPESCAPIEAALLGNDFPYRPLLESIYKEVTAAGLGGGVV